MTRTTALQSAARALQLAVVSSYVDNGHYPDRLSLDDPALSSLHGTGSLRVIERLDDYRASQDTFSVIVVAKGSGQRLRVTHRGIEDIPPPGGPEPARRCAVPAARARLISVRRARHDEEKR